MAKTTKRVATAMKPAPVLTASPADRPLWLPELVAFVRASPPMTSEVEIARQRLLAAIVRN